MKASILRLSVLCVVVSTLLVFAGCDNSLTGPTEESPATEETPKTLSDSVLEFPDSIRPVGSIDASSSRSLPSGTEGDVAVLYEMVPHYVDFAAGVRGFVVEIVDAVVQNLEWLESSGVAGTRQDMTDEDFSGFLFETDQVGTTGYDYRLTLYVDDGAQSEYAGLVADFSLNDAGWAHGIMRIDVDEAFEGTTLTGTMQAEIEFDATGNTKTLDIRYYKDLTDLITWAENGVGTGSPTATNTEVEAADLGQPEQISLNLALTDGTYTVTGYSFHPGIEVLDTREIDDFYSMFNNPGDGKTRHTFLFKAVVETEGGVETGAKLSVAFPDDGQTETAPEASLSDVWTNDALGKLYSQYMVDVVNQDMETKIATDAAGLFDGVFYSMWLHNTLPPVDETALVEARYNEFVTWIEAIKSGLDRATDEAAYIAGLPNTAKSTATDVRAEEIEFIEAMPADNSNTLTEQVQWFYYLVHELTTDDAYLYSDANTYYTGEATAEEQLLLWLCSYLPSAFQAILTDEPADPSQADDYHVSESHLRSFLSLEATDVLMLDAEMETGFNYLKALFESISYIINPAFYVAGSSTASNFVGTYDETAGSEQFYAYTPGSGLAPSSDETAIQDLKLLDLSAVADLVPADESVYFDGFDSPRL